jgi:hypothetical protein
MEHLWQKETKHCWQKENPFEAQKKSLRISNIIFLPIFLWQKKYPIL